MPELLFDPIYTCNLYCEMMNSREVTGVSDGSYIRGRISEVEKGGFLTGETRRRALEMFVFADKVTFSPEDISYPASLRGHLGPTGERLSTPGQQRPDIRALIPLIFQLQDKELLLPGSSLNREISENDIRRLCDYIDARDDYWSRWRAANSSGDLPPWYHVAGSKFQALEPWQVTPAEYDKRTEDLLGLRVRDAELDNLERDLSPLVREVAAINAAADRGVPTFFHQVRTQPPLSFDIERARSVLPEDTTTAVTLYFNGLVKAPRPETFDEALRLRENPSVTEWRQKVDSWSARLQSNKIDINAVKQEIKDANGYIEGASFPSSMLESFHMWMTLPLGAIALLTGDPNLAIMVFGIDALAALSRTVEKSVRSPDRLQYKWIMLNTNNVKSER